MMSNGEIIMKAVVYTKYGPPDVLQLTEIAKPAPRDNEVLIKVYATTVNRTDSAIIRAHPFFMRLFTGILKPKRPVPGTEFAGEVEAIGINVKSFKVGDRVFGFDDLGSGSQAEYMTISEDRGLTTIPGNMNYEEAAASTEGAHYAYNSIKKANLKRGQKALVYGATGAIGSAAVQLLKYFGVYVTAVCNTKNIGLVKSLGADKVVDYTRDDFTGDIEKYDFVFDAVGKSSFFKCQRLLKAGGVYVSSDLGFMAQNIVLPLITPVIKSLIGNKKTVFPVPSDIKGSVLLIKNLLEQGKFKPVIDRKYSLDQIIEAYRYVEKGEKTGNVIITVNRITY
jgi:NADPH:quinone reductase-like Zn-dependent oxidoreductase